MSQQLIFLAPSPTAEFIARFSELGEVVFIDEIKDFDKIQELHTQNEKTLVIDPDFVDWDLNKTKLNQIQNLKEIFLLSTSFSWVDLDYTKAQNIKVSNIRNWSSKAVAEWALLSTLSLLRRLPIILKGEQKADFSTQYLGGEIKNKLVGIVGLGNIGMEIAVTLQALGAKIKFWSKNDKECNFQKVSISELFSTCDIIVPCLAENEETKQIITDELIRSIKPSSVFISIIHHFYNHDLLQELVENNKISGYAFEQSNAKLVDFKGNIWVTPEYAWFTQESLQNMDDKLFENLEAAKNGQYPNLI
jgi:phosphoglycerate dehydrogenase-like enzyme